MSIKDRIGDLYNKSKDNVINPKIKLSYFKLFYFLFFLIIYISNQHSVEKKIRNINKLENVEIDKRVDKFLLENSLEINNSNIKFEGVDGSFYFKDNIIERNFKCI